MKFYYVDAIAGAGKSNNAIAYGIELALAGVLVIYATQTILGVDQVQRTFERQVEKSGRGPVARFIHGETPGVESPVQETISLLNSELNGGGFLCITMETLRRLPDLPVLWNADVIIDEVPAVYNIVRKKLSGSIGILASLTEQIPDGDYIRLKSVDDDGLNEILKRSEYDETYKPFVEPVGMILDRRSRTYVNGSFFRKALEDKSKKVPITFYQLASHKWLTRFKSVTIMGAGLTESLMYRHWCREIDFEKHPIISEGLPDNHSNGKLLDIYYLVEAWSAKKRNDDVAGNIYFSEFGRAVETLFGSEPFVLTANNAFKDPIVARLPEGKWMPPMIHGSNEFLSYDSVAVYSSFKKTVDEKAFLAFALGMNSEDAFHVTEFDMIYQAITRTSLRDPTSTSPKKVIVMDKKVAEFLKSKFPGSEFHKFPSDPISTISTKKPGRRKIHESDADRKSAAREKAKKDKLLQKLALLRSDPDGSDRTLLKNQKFCPEIPLRIENNNSIIFSCVITTLAKEYSKKPKSVEAITSWDSFLQYISDKHLEKISRKGDMEKINTTLFRKENGKWNTRTGKDAIEGYCLWFDSDNGKMTPEEFASFLPKTRMICYSTFSNAPEKLRYRIIIPLASPVDNKVYGKIIHDVHDMLDLEKIEHGFDPMFSLANIFNAPCRGEMPEHGFVKVFDGPGRYNFDPTPWILEPEPVDSVPVPVPIKLSHGHVDSAIRNWRNAPPGEGHHAFRRLAVALAYNIDSESEIENILMQEAAYGRSPKERKAEIKYIMSDIRKRQIV